MYLSVHGANQLRELSAKLKEAGNGRELRTQLRRDITTAMQPMRRDVQSNVEATPSHGSRHTGLRNRIARATRIKVNAGENPSVSLEVARSLMPEDQQSLPKLLEGRGRWRHPLFGDEETWINQKSHPYFWKGIRPHLREVREAIVQAVERAFDRLA